MNNPQAVISIIR